MLFATIPMCAHAQLDDDIIEGVIASSYKVEEHEQVLKYWRVPPKMSGDIRSYTLTVFGDHWTFLDGWNAQGTRVWRSRPLTLAECLDRNTTEEPITITSFGTDGVFLLVKGCEKGPGAFIRAPDGMMISFQPTYPVSTFDTWPAAGQQETVDYDTYLQDNWTKTPPTDIVGTPLPSPQHFSVRMEPAPNPISVSVSVAEARAILRDKSGTPIDAREKLYSALQQNDWRTAGLSIEDLNDLGYIFQQAGDSAEGTRGCGDLQDALLVLQEVIRRDPKRPVVYLNLADTYTSMNADNCSMPQSVRLLWAKDYYRQYCSMMGVSKVPAYTARRIARELDVARLDKESCTPQYAPLEAVLRRDLNGLEESLSDRSTNPSTIGPEGLTALYLSLKMKLPEFTRTLLEHGASPDLAGSSASLEPPLSLALWDYDVETVRLLAQKGARADVSRSSKDYIDAPLHIAAMLPADDANQQAKKTAMLSAILTTKPNLEVPDVDGETPLMRAVYSEDPEAVNLLLSAGAYVNASDKRKDTPLSKLVARDPERSVAICRALLKAGANVNQQGDGDETPLLRVLGTSGNKPQATAQVIKELLLHGADPNLPSSSGQSPLERAVDRSNLEVVRLLLKSGAKIKSAHYGMSGDVFHILDADRALYPQYENDGDRRHHATWNDWVEMEKLLRAAEDNSKPTDSPKS